MIILIYNVYLILILSFILSSIFKDKAPKVSVRTEVQGMIRKSSKNYIVVADSLIYLRNNYCPGDIVKVKLKSVKLADKNFHRINKIKQIAKGKLLKYQKNNNLKCKIRNLILRNDYKGYISSFVIGNNQIDSNVYFDYLNLGLAHLFAISGLHISIIIKFLIFLKIPIKLQYWILLFYAYICEWSNSITRAVTTYILVEMFYFKHLKSKVILLLFSLNILLNPYLIHSLGFLYSYTIAYFLSIKKAEDNSFIYIFIICIPLNIYFSNSINPLSIIYNIIFIPIISLILLPLSFLVLVLPILRNFLYVIIDALEFCVHIFPKTNIFISEISFNFVIILYLFMYFIYKKRPQNLKIFIISLLFFLKLLSYKTLVLDYDSEKHNFYFRYRNYQISINCHKAYYNGNNNYHFASKKKCIRNNSILLNKTYFLNLGDYKLVISDKKIEIIADNLKKVFKIKG